jgi:Domain of unknown function (DUF6249)
MASIPSAAAQVLLTVIPIVGIFMGSVVVFFHLLWRHKQHMQMIEKGLQPPRNFNLLSFSLVAGLVTASVGFVLSVFFVLTNGATYSLLGGLIPLAVGASLLLYYLLQHNESGR